MVNITKLQVTEQFLPHSNTKQIARFSPAVWWDHNDKFMLEDEYNVLKSVFNHIKNHKPKFSNKEIL